MDSGILNMYFVFRELADPLPIAELEKIHEIVRQDRTLPLAQTQLSLVTEKHRDHTDSSDFLTTRKANEFVSKFYKRKIDETRGF